MKKVILFISIFLLLFISSSTVQARPVADFDEKECTELEGFYWDGTQCVGNLTQVSEETCSRMSGFHWTGDKCVTNGAFSFSKVTCGNVSGIPRKVPEVTNWFVKIIQVAVPVLLVIFGSIDLVKSIAAGKEEEIKKGQQIFIKRLIVAALIFFIIVITKLLISLVDRSNNSKSISNCIDCFLVDVDKCIAE